MSSKPTVAIAGATGNLGPAILTQVLAAGFPVVVLTRQGSTSTSSLPSHPSQTIKEVDYSSTSSLTSALKGVKAVVSVLTTTAATQQKSLIDAAIAAGVTRFIPSEYGCDTTNEHAKKLPTYAGKVEIQGYLAEKVKENPEFSYTLLMTNPFFDWGVKMGFILNVKAKEQVVYSGGDVKFSTTTLPSIGKAVAGIVTNLEETKNKVVYVHDAVVTQNQLINIAKKLDPEHKEWKLTPKDPAENEKECYEELKKPSPDFGKAMVGFIMTALYTPSYGTNFTGKTSNELFGIKDMSEKEVEEVIRANT